MKKLMLLWKSLFLLFFAFNLQAQNPWNGKVVLQGFWWDYWNNNYPNAWANYLTDLAPRLRDLGIDGVWIPPTIKNGSTNSNGYSPFDHYDLGYKYQKGSLRTRVGTKDELLRMIAVMHANGMDVIQDIVLNHIDNAGSNTGDGGSDPGSSNGDGNSYKNFRYVSFLTPASSESSSNYLARSGRWPKNWPNFHGNSAHNCTSGDWCQAYFGPDICYYEGAFGASSNATFNPDQTSNYMRNQARNWLVWFKKQTGVDGFRFDAVKHFPHWALQDFIWNLKYNAGWANGGGQMMAIGEYVGSKAQLDGWINDVRYSNGGSEDLVGTFDFSLRQEIKNMVSGGGAYNLSNIPGSQQSNRYRTMPFVNNHDTFRPLKDANGNYIGWDTGNELGGGHIDPFDIRLEAAYAIAFAVDGSPQVFFEDLFDIGGTGKRYSHSPTSLANLPVRDGVANIIWCHQKLNFKKGSYKVRHQANDLLIIERGYNGGPENSYAIIGINDNWNTWQSATIQTDFGPNVRLHDYSGANASDIWTDASGRATIWVPPVDGSNVRRGYTIWGPAGISGGFAPTQRSTTQEWEMANDLGDNHASSLQQGGALPAASTVQRYVGKVFAEAGKSIVVNLYPDAPAHSLNVQLYNNGGSSVASQTGTGTLTLTYTPTVTGFYQIRVRNNSTSNPAQNVWVKATYTAPRVISTASYPARVVTSAEPETKETAIVSDLVVFPSPVVQQTTVQFGLSESRRIQLVVINASGQTVAQIADQRFDAGLHKIVWNAQDIPAGTYYIQLKSEQGQQIYKIVKTL